MGGVALGLAIGIAALVPAQPASAASPGLFNDAQCNPNNLSILQNIEAYRSWSTEKVALQGALVEKSSGVTYLSNWGGGPGPTARTYVTWTSVPRGNYNVFYRWGSWRADQGRWIYSGWVQVASDQLSTLGRHVGGGVYVGGARGRCSI
jgi:hypothetical protein